MAAAAPLPAGELDRYAIALEQVMARGPWPCLVFDLLTATVDL